MNNILANMINKIRLAHTNRETSVVLKMSVLLLRILKILQKEGVISGFTMISEYTKKDVNVRYVKVFLKYYRELLLFQK